MGWSERAYSGGSGGGYGGGGGFSDNPMMWSPTIMRVAGISVRLHMVFIIYMVFRFMEGLGQGHAGWTMAYLGILFGSVLLHEFGHCFAARSVGGSADDILMWPLGGLAFVNVPRRVAAEFITVICGPLVNVAIMLICAVALAVMGALEGNWWTLGWFYPSFGGSTSFVAMWLGITLGINKWLFLFNLIPMYPMDGGRMLHCAVWKFKGYNRSMLITATVGMVAAIVLGLAGLIGGTNLTLIMLAIFGYMMCYRERQVAKFRMLEGENIYSSEFSYEDGEFVEKEEQEGVVQRWRRKREEAASAKRRAEQEQLQQDVDRILEKVHAKGLASLSRSERKKLEDATRQRRGPSA